MSQEQQVLLCFSCETYQSQIVKKSTKWECKMCGEKQSRKKVFGQGNGKDCRIHVQRLNELRMKKKELDNGMTFNNCSTEPFMKGLGESTVTGASKWSKYLSQPKNDSDSDDSECNSSFPPMSSEFVSDPQEKKRRIDSESFCVSVLNRLNSNSSNENEVNMFMNPRHQIPRHVDNSCLSFSCSQPDIADTALCRPQVTGQSSNVTPFDVFNSIDFGLSQSTEELKNSFDLFKPSELDLQETMVPLKSRVKEDEDVHSFELKCSDSSDFDLSQISQELINNPEFFQWDMTAEEFDSEENVVFPKRTAHLSEESDSDTNLGRCSQECKVNPSNRVQQETKIIQEKDENIIANKNVLTDFTHKKNSTNSESTQASQTICSNSRQTSCKTELNGIGTELFTNMEQEHSDCSSVVNEIQLQLIDKCIGNENMTNSSRKNLKYTNGIGSKTLSLFDRSEDDYNDTELDAILSF